MAMAMVQNSKRKQQSKITAIWLHNHNSLLLKTIRALSHWFVVCGLEVCAPGSFLNNAAMAKKSEKTRTAKFKDMAI
jgi:hypothetical protein